MMRVPANLGDTMGGGMSIEMWLAEDGLRVLESELQQAVCDELAAEPLLDASDVHVDMDGRVATLSGTVHSFRERLAAERTARAVPGVVGCHNELGISDIR
ncbi:MAG TPA: BON domain-containing protein [Gemmatimonadales bacterium]|nr:BON domain-containing protein [Gemmatimonadales bacterium]